MTTKERAKHILFWILLIAVVALVIATPIWLLVPRSLAGVVDTRAPVRLYIQRPNEQEAVDLTIQPGTPEMEKLEAVLKRHTYHLHWTAIFGSTKAQAYVSDTYRILYDSFSISSAEEQSYQFGGELTYFKKNVRTDPYSKKDRILLLDYHGKTRGDTLRLELTEALEIA